MSVARRPILAGCFTALLFVGAGSALAESSDPPIDEVDAQERTDSTQARPARRKREGVEEIIVTGRRREENLQAIPLSIQAFSETDLKDKEIRDLQDVTRYVPNLQFDQAQGSGNNSRVYLRGVGNGDSIITDEGGVGIYVDGVYLPRSSGTLLAVSDIERVEVLSGPQGSLYGKNTIGGLVNVITKKPSFDRKGNAEVRIGNFDTLDTKLSFNLPLVDERAAMRFSFATRYNEGFVENEAFGGDSRSQNRRSLNARIQLLLQPVDDLELLFSAHQSKEPNKGYSPKCKFVSAPTGLSAALFPNYGEECQRSEASDSDKVFADGELESRLRTYGTYMQATWAAADWLKIKSTTAWNRNKTTNAFDADATGLPINQGARDDKDDSKQDSISQEINLSGSVMSGRLNWIGGVYGLSEKNQDNLRSTDRPSTRGNPATLTFVQVPVPMLNLPDGVLGIANGASRQCLPGTSGTALRDNGTSVATCQRTFEGVRSTGFLKSNVLSYAAYGHFDVALTERLNLSAGVRFTHEQRRVARFRLVDEADRARVFTPTSAASTGILTDFERSNRIGKFTPSANIGYQWNDDINLYATFGKGFKSGGFNGRALGDGNERTTYDPENLASYEVGVKTRWLDRRLVVNAAWFHNEYTDIQLPNLMLTNGSRISLIVDNAGRASINGFELSAQASPLENLDLSATLGVTAARYEKFEPGARSTAIR
jgi:iron complex outermembrane recepter protein